MKILFTLFIISCGYCAPAQSTYSDSIQKFRQEYVATHEAVKEKDKKYIQFFAPDAAFRVQAMFKETIGAAWFKMKTTGVLTPLYREYGTLFFMLQGKNLSLKVYQSQSLLDISGYKDYLFVPFTDASNGAESYKGGRYIDLRMSDLKNGQIMLDFNKSYNPYCAYETGYNCPVPPAENALVITVNAGEKTYSKHH